MCDVGSNLPLDLVSNLHRLVLNLLSFITTQVELLCPHLFSSLRQLGHRRKIKVRAQVPEARARDTNQRTIRKLCLATLDRLNSLLVDCHFMETSLDEAAGEMLDLLAGLDEEVVAWGDLDGDAVAGVAGPDVEAGVA
jgi:hypothetical protein